MKDYEGMIHPIIDQKMWPPDGTGPIQPPVLRRLPGRSKMNRRKEHDECETKTSQSKRSLSVKCHICKEFGHNKRTCQRAPVRGNNKRRPIQEVNSYWFLLIFNKNID